MLNSKLKARIARELDLLSEIRSAARLFDRGPQHLPLDLPFTFDDDEGSERRLRGALDELKRCVELAEAELDGSLQGEDRDRILTLLKVHASAKEVVGIAFEKWNFERDAAQLFKSLVEPTH